jgi:3-keto-5-aminohexanoate cleavage enzyme
VGRPPCGLDVRSRAPISVATGTDGRLWLSTDVSDAAIITCALSGAVANKQQCPGIPYTPEEYAKEVRRARDAGASMVHVHARTPDGTPTVAAEHYRAITRAILEEAPDVIVNFSTGWVGLPIAAIID